MLEALGWPVSHARELDNAQQTSVNMLCFSVAKSLHKTVPSTCTRGNPRIGPLEKCNLIGAGCEGEEGPQ